MSHRTVDLPPDALDRLRALHADLERTQERGNAFFAGLMLASGLPPQTGFVGFTPRGVLVDVPDPPVEAPPDAPA